ncbi:hypothetical protein BC643_0097 [Mangrovibacterium diazotrophicum]|uniref:Uncharacterized protein n=1 Tax=Mangrovibacterium diazotrophicum TaxID=1261403 RepID=A0A419W2Q8_9BACT|nr:hypothetical protein BC643_0097 [Mangrovibacterium diazotrophicum]
MLFCGYFSILAIDLIYQVINDLQTEQPMKSIPNRSSRLLLLLNSQKGIFHVPS